MAGKKKAAPKKSKKAVKQKPAKAPATPNVYRLDQGESLPAPEEK